MKAGTLNDRVTIQQVTITQGDTGQPVESWSDVGTCWASVSPSRSREQFISAADQRVATADFTVAVRYISGLSPVNHRLLHKGNVLDILAVRDPDGRRASQLVYCKRIVDAGSVTV